MTVSTVLSLGSRRQVQVLPGISQEIFRGTTAIAEFPNGRPSQTSSTSVPCIVCNLWLLQLLQSEYMAGCTLLEARIGPIITVRPLRFRWTGGMMLDIRGIHVQQHGQTDRGFRVSVDRIQFTDGCRRLDLRLVGKWPDRQFLNAT